tara:strand:+ start:34 stop:807 length:774 start_codon:yes stop_codon:yes gene_type:complete
MDKKSMKVSKTPQVLPVKAESGNKSKSHHDFLPHVGVGTPGAGSLLCMLSPRNTGKSTIISNLFLNPNFYGEEFFDEVYIISPTINIDRTSRFLAKRFTTFDKYSPEVLEGIIKSQLSFDEEDRPEIAVVLDDCVGILDKAVANLATRSRHYGIKLLVISSQKFRGALDPIIRANTTDLIVGSPFPNQRELQAISEEFGDMFGGPKKFLEMYHQATPSKYDFFTAKLTNPPRAFQRFDRELQFTQIENEELKNAINI